MRRKFTVLTMLIFSTTSLFAQKYEYKDTRELERSLSNKRFETVENSKIPNPLKKNMAFQEGTSHLKSAQNNIQKLDSLVHQRWDENTSQWINSKKDEFIYDANGNVTQRLYSEWAKSIDQWVIFNKTGYVYDANNNNTIRIPFHWDEATSQWQEDGSKIEYTYDTNGNMTELIYISKGETMYKYEYTYDNSGNLTQSTSYDFDYTGKMSYTSKNEYAYDANGNVTQLLYSKWNISTNQWINSTKYEFTNDVNGNQTMRINFEWDPTSNQWLNSRKDEDTYDTNGNHIMSISYKWDNSTNQWIEGSFKYEYTYDANDNPSTEILYEWYNSQWEGLYKHYYTYDLSINFSNLIFPPISYIEPYFYIDKILNKPIEYSQDDWDEVSNDWIIDYKGIYYYSEQNSTSVSDINVAEINIYPNPSSQDVTFNIIGNYNQITFELFDMQGRKVMFKEISNNENISIEKLNSGMYLYGLVLDGEKRYGKLIKE